MWQNKGVLIPPILNTSADHFLTTVDDHDIDIEIRTCLALAKLYDDPTPGVNNFDVPWDWRNDYEKCNELSHKLSNKTIKLLKEMETELMKALPSDDMLKTPLRLKDRQEWADCMLEILAMMDYIISLDISTTIPHKLKEIGAIAEMTSERIRQIEQHGLKRSVTYFLKVSTRNFKEPWSNM